MTKSWCPSQLSARLMEHGINPCPAVKVSDLRMGIKSSAVAFLLQECEKFCLSDSFCPCHSLMDVLSGRACGGPPLIHIFLLAKIQMFFFPYKNAYNITQKLVWCCNLWKQNILIWDLFWDNLSLTTVLADSSHHGPNAQTFSQSIFDSHLPFLSLLQLWTVAALKTWPMVYSAMLLNLQTMSTSQWSHTSAMSPITRSSPERAVVSPNPTQSPKPAPEKPSHASN